MGMPIVEVVGARAMRINDITTTSMNRCATYMAHF